MNVDTANWSGEGDFTQLLVDRLQQIDDVVLVRVEDAPTTRSEADYHFLSNEIFVGFATRERREPAKRFGIFPATRVVHDKLLTMSGLETRLAAITDVGAPDYADDGMLQYLRTERIIPPYQTRGYKLVELVRIYEASSATGPSAPNDQMITRP
jgi:hypothetical protein